MMESTPKKKRVTLDMPFELANVVKKAAIDKNCTMAKWIMQACIRQLKFERDERMQL